MSKLLSSTVQKRKKKGYWSGLLIAYCTLPAPLRHTPACPALPAVPGQAARPPRGDLREVLVATRFLPSEAFSSAGILPREEEVVEEEEKEEEGPEPPQRRGNAGKTRRRFLAAAPSPASPAC